MKKKLMAILMSAVMVLGAFSTVAFAEGMAEAAEEEMTEAGTGRETTEA